VFFVTEFLDTGCVLQKIVKWWFFAISSLVPEGTNSLSSAYYFMRLARARGSEKNVCAAHVVRAVLTMRV
jgi:uncharacterized protein (DUF2267 family)